MLIFRPERNNIKEDYCMITLIVGKKGSGKTKKLIQLANDAVKTSNGNVVCIEKGAKLTYDIDHKAMSRLFQCSLH